MKNTKKNQTVQTAETKQNSATEQKQTAETKKEEKVMKEQKQTTEKKTTAAEKKAAEKAAAQEKILEMKSHLLNTLFTEIQNSNLTPYNWRSNEKMSNLLAIRAGKKTIAEIYVGKKSYRVNVKQVVLDSMKVENYVTIKNYYLPACMKDIPLKDTKTLVKLVKTLAKLYSEYLPTEA